MDCGRAFLHKNYSAIQYLVCVMNYNCLKKDSFSSHPLYCPRLHSPTVSKPAWGQVYNSCDPLSQTHPLSMYIYTHQNLWTACPIEKMKTDLKSLYVCMYYEHVPFVLQCLYVPCVCRFCRGGCFNPPPPVPLARPYRTDTPSPPPPAPHSIECVAG